MVRLESAHGFIDEAGAHRFWKPGIDITDPADIAVLIERGAPLATIG